MKSTALMLMGLTTIAFLVAVGFCYYGVTVEHYFSAVVYFLLACINLWLFIVNYRTYRRT